MCQGSFYGVSRVFQGSFKKSLKQVSREFEGYFKKVSVAFKDVSREF